MQYPPPYHLDHNKHNAYKVIEACKLATVISPIQDDVLVTHIPLILNLDKGSLGSLVGHIDKNNPQAKYLNNHKITAIFHGPDAYISPTVYASRQLPTWNYITTHVKGTAHHLPSDDAVRDSLIHMAEQLEDSEQPFVLNPDDKRIPALLNHIVGFEIEIEDLVGRFKLSQDKLQQDRMNAKQQLLSQTIDNETILVNQLCQVTSKQET